MSTSFIFIGVMGWFVTVVITYSLLLRYSPKGERPPIRSAIRWNIMKETGGELAIAYSQLYFLFVLAIGIVFSILGNGIFDSEYGGLVYLLFLVLPILFESLLSWIRLKIK